MLIQGTESEGLGWFGRFSLALVWKHTDGIRNSSECWHASSHISRSKLPSLCFLNESLLCSAYSTKLCDVLEAEWSTLPLVPNGVAILFNRRCGVLCPSRFRYSTDSQALQFLASVRSIGELTVLPTQVLRASGPFHLLLQSQYLFTNRRPVYPRPKPSPGRFGPLNRSENTRLAVGLTPCCVRIVTHMHQHQLRKSKSVMVWAAEANEAALRSWPDLLITSVPTIVPFLPAVLHSSSEGPLCLITEQQQRQRRPALRRGPEVVQTYPCSAPTLSSPLICPQQHNPARRSRSVINPSGGDKEASTQERPRSRALLSRFCPLLITVPYLSAAAEVPLGGPALS